MGSFYAELTVGGETYPLRQCHYEFTQATDQRGRAAAKVRHGELTLSLDVPDGEGLRTWAAARFKPLAGHITFFDDAQRTALETVSFESGHCIGYREHFQSGDTTSGAYVCHLTIVAEKLTLSAGGPPGPFAAPAPREVAAHAVSPGLTPAELHGRQWFASFGQSFKQSAADFGDYLKSAALHPVANHVGAAQRAAQALAHPLQTAQTAWQGAVRVYQDVTSPNPAISGSATGSLAFGGTLALATEGAAKGIGALETFAADGAVAGSIRHINKVGGHINCVNCTIATDATLAGRPASALNAKTVQPIAVLAKEFGAKFTHGLDINGIKKLVSKPGQRGIVFGNRGLGAEGHVFNVVNQNGVVRFLDGQTGKAANLNGYKNFSFLPTTK